MSNRLTRDEILARALDMADAQALDRKERPGGVLHANAMCIAWLQDALDLFHRTFPWTGLITSTALPITNSTNLYALPTDYSQDVKNGVRLMQASPLVKRRLHRKSLSWFLGRDTTSDAANEPEAYVIVGTNVYLWPWPKTSYSGEFWYYKLPAVLAGNQRPNFPDDWTLVEYVRLRAKEWIGEVEAGSAVTSARKTIGELKKAGLGEESEHDALELDASFFRPSGQPSGASTDWMGESIPR